MPSPICGNCHGYFRGAPTDDQACHCDAPAEIVMGPATSAKIKEVRWVVIDPLKDDVPRCAGSNWTKAGREMHCSAPAVVWRHLVMRDGYIIPRQFCLIHALPEGHQP